MTLEQAKNFVAKTYPNALWVITSRFEGEPDTYAILDFTFSDEARAKLFTYDNCTESLFDCSSGRELTL